MEGSRQIFLRIIGRTQICPSDRRSWIFLILRIITRLIVSVHFVYELQDKIVNFNHWNEVINTQAGLGVWALVLVIVLLSIGCVSLLLGRLLWLGFACLAIFQIPTSILFEDSMYESMDSVSALGGVLAITVWACEANRDPLCVSKCGAAVEREPLQEGLLREST